MLSVKALLTKILEMLTVESRTYTSQYASAIKVYRYGKVVTIILSNMISVPNGTSLLLFTLPAGWRPLYLCMELLRNPTDIATSMMRVSAYPDGNVYVYQYGSATSSASTNASCTLTFIAS